MIFDDYKWFWTIAGASEDIRPAIEDFLRGSTASCAPSDRTGPTRGRSQSAGQDASHLRIHRPGHGTVPTVDCARVSADQRQSGRPSTFADLDHSQIPLRSLHRRGKWQWHWNVWFPCYFFCSFQSRNEGETTAMETCEPSEGSGQETAAEAAVRLRKAEVAAARRAAILAQMSAQQKSFIKEHAQLFQETGYPSETCFSKLVVSNNYC